MRSILRSTALVAAVAATALAAASPAAQAQRPAEPQQQRAADLPIVLTEQGFDQIVVLDPTKAAFGSFTTRWVWKPTATNGFADLVDNWGLPDEAQLRHRGDQQYLLTTDSKGLAAVVPYPQGTGAYWATDVGAANNPHSAELLPDGNVAVSASNGGFIRIYAASQGPRATRHAQFDLPGAHGVYYDPLTRLLWAVGSTDIVGLEVGGSAAAPTVHAVVRTALPSGGGHDLFPVASDPDRLWVTNVAGVFQYSLVDHTFSKDFPGRAAIDAPNVKSIGDAPGSGQVALSAIQPGNACSWCTDTVSLFRPRARLMLHGGQIYKARWWIDPRP